jgi:predicted nuclease of predicted toxin-antitoxin system
MKLLFDQNLAPKLVKRLEDLFPGSSHVFLVGLDRKDDRSARKYAEDHEFVIVTKDAELQRPVVITWFFAKGDLDQAGQLLYG